MWCDNFLRHRDGYDKANNEVNVGTHVHTHTHTYTHTDAVIIKSNWGRLWIVLLDSWCCCFVVVVDVGVIVVAVFLSLPQSLPLPCQCWRFNRISPVKEHAKEHPKRSCKLSGSCSRHVMEKGYRAGWGGSSYALLFTWCYFNNAHTHEPNLMSSPSPIVPSRFACAKLIFTAIHKSLVRHGIIPILDPIRRMQNEMVFLSNKNRLHLIRPKKELYLISRTWYVIESPSKSDNLRGLIVLFCVDSWSHNTCCHWSELQTCRYGIKVDFSISW